MAPQPAQHITQLYDLIIYHSTSKRTVGRGSPDADILGSVVAASRTRDADSDQCWGFYGELHFLSFLLLPPLS